MGRLNTPNAEEETQDIRLLLFVELPNVFVCAHLAAGTSDISLQRSQTSSAATYLLLGVVERGGGFPTLPSQKGNGRLKQLCSTSGNLRTTFRPGLLDHNKFTLIHVDDTLQCTLTSRRLMLSPLLPKLVPGSDHKKNPCGYHQGYAKHRNEQATPHF